MSRIIVQMNTCQKTHAVNAKLNEDGDVDIDIETDCEKIQHFNKVLRYVTMQDVTDFYNSRLSQKEIRQGIGFVCMVPNAVAQAAWMELGMLLGSHAEKSEFNAVVYSDEAAEKLRSLHV